VELDDADVDAFVHDDVHNLIFLGGGLQQDNGVDDVDDDAVLEEFADTVIEYFTSPN
jgi:hypothetical protein